MFQYVTDREFLAEAMRICTKIVTKTTGLLVRGRKFRDVRFKLVGSGGRKMITQNGKEPADFDYNLYLVDYDRSLPGKEIKEAVRKAFNEALRFLGYRDCEDSTSSLTSKLISVPPLGTSFSIDVCIVRRDGDGYLYRLIHDKKPRSGAKQEGVYCWNKAPNTRNLETKEKAIKSAGRWNDVRDGYLDLKNTYLKSGEHHHTSRICYIETVSNVYNALRTKGLI